MPKRTDIKSILIIGAGPIIIGQACEFDYSGTQACKALKDEGYRVILVNSNPATIMTDPDLADATYMEPITPEIVAKIIEKERPDALLPTMGGQTALNCALSLRKMGVLEKFGVEMIGATAEAIDKAEDRELFREAMKKIGLETPRSMLAHNIIEALQALEVIGLPCIIRPSFTLGGTGGGIAYNREEYPRHRRERHRRLAHQRSADRGIACSAGKSSRWRLSATRTDNCIIVCSIENLDPMGVHTGDSITVAPALTLTDKEYQIMRDAIDRGAARDRRRDRRLQRPVRRQSRRRPPGRHRDEPARLALLGARLEGHRLPHRQGRRAARRRLHPRRARERHHRRRDPGLASSRPSTTSSPRSRASRSRNSPAPTTASPPR